MAKNARERAVFVTLMQGYDRTDDDVPMGGSDDGYRLRVMAYIVSCNPDGTDIKTEKYYSDFKHAIAGEHLGDFHINCRARRKDRGVYTMEYKYQDVFSVDQRQAEGMVKVFKYVERGREKLADQHGWEQDAGQYITRIGMILGATRVILVKRGLGEPGGFDRNASNYAHLKLGEAVNAINSRVEAWFDGVQEQEGRVY